MVSRLSRKELEQFFKEEILSKYNLDTSRVVWKEYGSVDQLNTHIHDFSMGYKDYFLVFQYSAGGEYPLDDEGLLIPVPGTASRYVEYRADVAKSERIENVTGYFSLYRTRSRGEFMQGL